MGVAAGGVSPTFSGLETDRPALMQSVYEQQRRDMSEFKGQVEDYFKKQQDDLANSKAESEELKRQMTQMMADFTAEIKNIQDERARDSERLAQLSEQQKQMELNAPVDGTTQADGNSTIRVTRKPLVQHPMGVAPSLNAQGLVDNAAGLVKDSEKDSETAAASTEPPPFIPPLGFVHATLLNGVDALTSGGAPALARISGVYKTAMNSTVSLDGCIVMMNFAGNVSTERAEGKPQRMTCVNADGGAVTYDLSGYAVDAQDGIVGIPGVFYEGDSTRVAAAMMADFAAGIGEMISQNQNTSTVDSDGTTKTTLTGSQVKSEAASGVNKAMSSLSTYLNERVNRVTPFVRLDAMRDIDLVILNGVQLRADGGGNAWTQLFDATVNGGKTAPSKLPQ
jgi:hypothetical protein